MLYFDFPSLIASLPFTVNTAPDNSVFSSSDFTFVNSNLYFAGFSSFISTTCIPSEPLVISIVK